MRTRRSFHLVARRPSTMSRDGLRTFSELLAETQHDDYAGDLSPVYATFTAEAANTRTQAELLAVAASNPNLRGVRYATRTSAFLLNTWSEPSSHSRCRTDSRIPDQNEPKTLEELVKTIPTLSSTSIIYLNIWTAHSSTLYITSINCYRIKDIRTDDLVRYELSDDNRCGSGRNRSSRSPRSAAGTRAGTRDAPPRTRRAPDKISSAPVGKFFRS